MMKLHLTHLKSVLPFTVVKMENFILVRTRLEARGGIMPVTTATSMVTTVQLEQ